MISSSEIGYRRVHEWNECTLVSYWIEEIITSSFPSTSELVRLQLWPQWSRLRGDGAVTWYEIVYYGFVCAYRMWSTKQQHQAIDVLKCTPQKNEYCNIYLHTKVSIRLSVLSQSSTTVTALVRVICTGVVTIISCIVIVFLDKDYIYRPFRTYYIKAIAEYYDLFWEVRLAAAAVYQ